MENNVDLNIVEATVYLKNKNNHSTNQKIIFTTFIDNGHLYVINNIGNKQILLGKDKSSEFESLITALKIEHNIDGFEKVKIDASKYKEDETIESIRLKKSIDTNQRPKIKNKP